MPLFTWSDKYSIGNFEIDNQHKKLFDILNRLFDICVGKNEVDTVEAVMEDLVSYTDYHFRFEEQYMRDVEYNDIERHMSLHKYFSARLLDIKEREKNDNNDLCRELIYFLGNWLKHHVVEDDKRISL